MFIEPQSMSNAKMTRFRISLALAMDFSTAHAVERIIMGLVSDSHVKLCDALMMKGITQFKTNLVNSFSFLLCRYFANPVDLIIISIFIFVRIDPRQLHGKAD